MLFTLFAAPVANASKEELMVLTVTEIINQLVQAHNNNQDINLNRWEQLAFKISSFHNESSKTKQSFHADICGFHVEFHFNRVKTRVASKYGLPSQPRLVDIIAAVPQQYKKVN